MTRTDKKRDIIVGLDIGTTKICAVIGEVDEYDVVHVIGVGQSTTTGIRRGVVMNIEQTVQAIKNALDEAELMTSCTIRSVYVGIAGTHIECYDSHGNVKIEGDEVTPDDLERVMRSTIISLQPSQEIIHTLPQEYIIDDQHGIMQPIGIVGVRLEVRVLIVAGARSSMENITRACTRSGLNIEGIVLESLATSEAVISDEEKEMGVVLVDIGGGTTDIAIFTNGAIQQASVLPLGGNNLTNDIAHGLRIRHEDAENIKLEYASALMERVDLENFIEVPGVGGRQPQIRSRQFLAEICEARCEEILALVKQKINQSRVKESDLTAGIVLTGGTALIEDIAELAEQIFALPVRIGYPTENPDKVQGLTKDIASPIYSTAVGLLLHGAKERLEDESTPYLRSKPAKKGSGMFAKIKDWFADIV